MPRCNIGLVALLAAAVLAEGRSLAEEVDWRCRNADVELRCGDGRCQVAPEHTPGAFSLSHSGAVSLCLYTGCWETEAHVLVRGDETISIQAHGVPFSTSENPGLIVDLGATIDVSRRIAVVSVIDFVLPMLCEAVPPA
ncbi:MAG: hypothetical protein R3F55_18565 [Alphaproteobacteria bacterium]